MFGCPSARFAAMMVLGAVTGCSGLADNERIPPDKRDPAAVRTPAGAMALYRGTLVQFGRSVNTVMLNGGLLTDELVALGTPFGYTENAWRDFASLDTRTLPEGSAFEGGFYGDLHGTRSQAREARGYLQDYAPDSSSAFRGMLFAAEAYAEVLLADLFCSGIPLSTLDYGKDFTLRPGSSTEAVYQHAIELFDSAHALSGDSARFQFLSAVGRARAHLALGNYAAAAASVAGVPDNFVFGYTFNPSSAENTSIRLSLWQWSTPYASTQDLAPTVADLEGHNGLNYRSSGDPRTRVEYRWVNQYGDSMFLPLKYRAGVPAVIRIASGIEANLIRAEAALHAGSPSWLDMLNALRTDGTVTVTPRPGDPATLDSTWNAGTGGVAGLAPLTDPGTVNARQDLLFRERAFWLHLTGQRQGDLRRLIRNYGRDPATLYPIGGDYKGANGVYNHDVTVPVPRTERQYNPQYSGCIHRNA